MFDTLADGGGRNAGFVQQELSRIKCCGAVDDRLGDEARHKLDRHALDELISCARRPFHPRDKASSNH